MTVLYYDLGFGKYPETQNKSEICVPVRCGAIATAILLLSNK